LALPLLEPLSKLEAIKGSPEITSYENFNYQRWHLISVISIMTKQKLHHYPLIEQTVDNIDIEIWIASLVDIINEIKLIF
jgi:hypothetical protein